MPQRVTVASSAHDVADGRLHRLVAGFRRAGLEVEVLALGDRDDAPEADRVRLEPRGGLARRVRRALAHPWAAGGSVLVVLDPDLVPAASLWRRLGRLTGRRRHLVVDVHEDYSAVAGDRAWARGARGRLVVVVARLLTRATTALAARADLTVVADDHLPPTRARSRMVVRNTPDSAYLPRPVDLPGEPRALYVGDLRGSRGLWTMLRAVEQAPQWHLDLVGPLAPHEQAAVHEWVATSPAAGRVHFHGRQPPERAWRLAERAWCGLCVLEDTPAFRRAVPSKLYEYLGCGLATVVSPLPRQVALVQEAGSGPVVRTADELADLLRRWAAEPEALVPLRHAARDWSDRHLSTPGEYDRLAGRVAAMASTSQGGAVSAAGP